MKNTCFNQLERAALHTLATMPTGPHLANPCYSTRRQVKDQAQQALAAALLDT